MIHLERGNWRVRDHTDERSIYRWRIAGLEVLRGLHADNLVRSAIVLVGGIGGTVGWKAKALGWNQEL